MKASSISKVTLRQEKLKSGKLSLYLDFYPPIWNPNIKAEVLIDNLPLLIFRFRLVLEVGEEVSVLLGLVDEAKLFIDNCHLTLRTNATRFYQNGFVVVHLKFVLRLGDKIQTEKFPARHLLDVRIPDRRVEVEVESKYQKWEIVYKHFCEFTNGRCLIKDVTIGLCNDFRSHILSLRVKKKKYAKIATNSAAGYWSTFRALLKMAYKEGLLNENINDHLESIDWEEPKINFLEIEEIKKLAATPCKVDVLKRASLFACLTGLRISDILQLKWDNIENLRYCVDVGAVGYQQGCVGVA